MIKIFIVSIIIMLYEHGLKKSVSTLQKRNYAPKKLKPWVVLVDVDFNIHQNHQQCSGLDVYHVAPWNIWNMF